MRNLKKVLALALATVMLLGMMAMASAADYADETAIADKYDVAVDVMNKIGVFEGDPAGNFNPTNTLNRAEAAKVIAYVGLTKTNAGKLAAAELPFEDVADARWAWAVPSIAYAKNMGIVDGVNAEKTLYDPAGTLTGFQFAKMLLTTLGYKATVEGYVGAGWDINVHLDALDAGLLKGLDIDLAADITREEAAQMAFNALQANTVVYANASSIVIGGVAIQNGGTLTEKETLMAKLYTKLSQGTKVDDFGYAYNTWLYDGKEVAAGADYTVLATYTDAADLTKDVLFGLVGKDTEAVDVDVYVNGADVETFPVTKDDYKTKTDVEFPEYKGAVLEVVKNDGNIAVMVSKAEVAKVTKVNDATALAKRSIVVAGDTIETEAYAKDQYIYVWMNGEEVIKHAAIAEADVVTGTVTQVAGVAGTKITAIYVAGTEYAVAGTDYAFSAANPNMGKDYQVIFQNGYAVYAVAVEETVVADKLADYVYVVAQSGTAVEENTAFGTAASGAAAVYETQVVALDGTVSIVKTNAVFKAVPTEEDELALGTIYKMTEKKGLKLFEEATVLAFDEDDAVANETDYFFIGGIPTENSGVYDFEDKFHTFTGEKLYATANTKVLTLEDLMDNQQVPQPTGFVKAAKVTAAPAEGTLDTVIGAVYSWNKTAKVRELEMIITKATVEFTADDLYYVVGTVLGTVYDATANEGEGETYKLVAAYEVATGTKKTVKVETVVDGFFYATVENDVYTFEDAASYIDETLYVAAAKGITVYNNLLTAECGATDITDEEVGAAKVVDVKAGTVDTVAKLVAKSSEGTTGKAVTFYTVLDEESAIAYIVVTAY